MSVLRPCDDSLNISSRRKRGRRKRKKKGGEGQGEHSKRRLTVRENLCPPLLACKRKGKKRGGGRGLNQAGDEGNPARGVFSRATEQVSDQITSDWGKKKKRGKKGKGKKRGGGGERLRRFASSIVTAMTSKRKKKRKKKRGRGERESG